MNNLIQDKESNHNKFVHSTSRETLKSHSFDIASPELSIQRKLQNLADNSPQVQNIAQLKPNNTGLPDNLKTGIENLSGYSMDDVKVHYNSSKPAQLNAHAYAQGTDIHLASGQEKHLPHEAWHVVQQKQGRVKPTMQMKDKVNINDDAGLEKEADVMGAKALHHQNKNDNNHHLESNPTNKSSLSPLQRIAESALTPASENGKYMLPGGEPEVLYTRHDAPQPEPLGLYVKGSEPVTGGIVNYSVKTYRPNVTFFSKDEQTGFVAALEENKKKATTKLTEAEGLSLIQKLIAEYQINSEKERLEQEIVKYWKALISEKQVEIDELMEVGADMGILGNNDCALFARALHQIIKWTHGVTSSEAPDSPQVGTFMQHKFPEKTGGCGYHGVTIVAKDGSSLITLEAHASNKTLIHPTFQIRNGVDGFRSDNTPSGITDESRKKKWEESEVILEHISGPSDQQLGGSLEELSDNYTKQPESPQEVGIHMMSMGLSLKKGELSAAKDLKKYIPAYRAFILEMPKGQYQNAAISWFNKAILLFNHAQKVDFAEAQKLLLQSKKYFENSYDQVLEDRRVRERNSRYS